MIEFIFTLFFITIVNAETDSNFPRIEISNGLLQGVYEKSYNGRIFSSFEGIPYARPPVGELRFEPPKEPYNWTGTWIANTKHTCLQTVEHSVMGDEDCLYLNVYVPRENPNPTDNLKVIVHIHGGGFSMWSGHVYTGPKYLMDEDVIFVTMNYRLGPFGFLSTEDEITPGNNGMKDQVLSLKWIQKNIKYFGGNPDSVTITGMSAGGASVHLHYFSPLSKDLFHQGVSQSGNAFDPWCLKYSPLKDTILLAEAVGCPTTTSGELIACLKSRSGIKIYETLKTLQFSAPTPLAFGPVVESKHEGAFLKQHPYKMLVDKTVADIPWVVSVAEKEGIVLLADLAKVMPSTGDNFENFIPQLLFYQSADEKAQKFATNKIKDHYFKEISQDFGEVFVDIIGDRLFASGADTTAKLQALANKSPVYFYRFEYTGQHCAMELVIPNIKPVAATHGDDTLYYLQSPIAEKKLSESDEEMKTIFMQWLLNFAETQEPKIEGVKWNPVTSGDVLDFLRLKGPDNLFMETAYDFGSSSLWNKLPFKENEIREKIRDEL